VTPDVPPDRSALSVTEAVSVLAAFASLAIVWTFPLILHLRAHIASEAGDPVLVAWMLAWDADRLRHGLSGIWDAPNFFPYPHTLLYSEHFLGVAVFTAPLQWLSRNPIFVYNVAFLGSQILTGFGMYVLARWLTGRRDAAFVASLVFACQPYRASHSAHLQLLVLGWLPLSLWALHRYFQSQRLRYLLATTLFFLLQALTCGYFAYFGLLPLGLAFAYELWRTRWFSRSLVGHLVVASSLAAVVMLPVVRAYADVRREGGLRRPLDEIVDQSADVGDYVSASPALSLWGGMGSGRGEHELFPGFMAVGLAIVAISGIRRRDSRDAVVLYGSMLVGAFVLSLGPSPKAFGHAIAVPSPYAWLLHVTPGLDGLRVPARLAVIVQVALAVLAGFGAIRVIEWSAARSESLRPVAIGLLAILVGAEGWAALGLPAFDYRGTPEERAAYEYLRSLPAGATIELPTMAEHLLPEFRYQYMTLLHGHRIVNGHSGYVTPLAVWLRGGHSPLREAGRQRDAVEMLRSLGVRYIVVHQQQYEDASLADELMQIIENDPQVIAHNTSGSTTVAVLAPLEQTQLPPAVTRIPSSSITADASDGADRLPLLFDGDRDSRWLTGHPQSGGEWLNLQFDRTRGVRVARFQLGARSFGDYPRRLAIDVVQDGTATTVFEGSVLPAFARGILSDADYPWIDIVLPANSARALRFRQVGKARTFYWSVHELQLLEDSAAPK
jgi:hypothetical protein